MAYLQGIGKTPPGWIDYLVLAGAWKIEPWKLEKLDNEDEEVSLWVERVRMVCREQARIKSEIYPNRRLIF